MLQSLTVYQLNDRAEDARQRLARVEKTITKLTRERDGMKEQLEARFLPELSGTTFRAMQENFPAFLTAERASSFKKNSKFFFGFFKPGGHDHVLALLQAQFRAFLDTCGRFSNEDAELAAQSRKAAALRTELADIEREKVARAKRVEPTRITPTAKPQGVRHAAPVTQAARAPQRQVVREEVVVVNNDDDGVVGFMTAVAMAESNRDCPAPVIATDDSLGCFS